MKLAVRTIAALTLALGGIASGQGADRYNIVTVDMLALFQAYHETDTFRTKVDSDQQAVKKLIDEREARVMAARTELETLEKQIKDPSIADAKRQSLISERQVKMQEAEGFARELDEFRQRKMRAFQEEIQVRSKEIMEKIRAKVAAHAEKEAYDHVLDKTGTSAALVPIIIYAKDATDITEVMLKTINDDAPPAAGGADK